MAIQTATKDVKSEAESLFKPAPKTEETPGRRTHAVLEDISDAELERRLNELQNERIRRREQQREKLEQEARHQWEKDKETFISLCRKLHKNNGFREQFVEVATKANGAFSPDLLLERDLPVAYLPEDLRPEGVTKVKKSTGRGGAASALSEKAPERGAGGETQEEIIKRVVEEGKGKPMTLEEVLAAISIDEVFGAYLKKEPRGLSRKIGGVAKKGVIKKTPDGKYIPA